MASEPRARARGPLAGVVRMLGAVAVFYGLVCLGMFLGQRRLLYFPDPTPTNASASALPDVQTLALPTPDGERLVAWWVPPRDAARPVYLYLHGNGANLDARVDRFTQLVADGAGLYALSWRGYGGSTGTPTERGLDIDARAAYADLVSRVDPARVIVFGESLGSTVAVMLAADAKVGALLLDSSFASALGVAERSYPWLPVRLLLRDTFRADLAAPRVTAPVFQVHCSADAITPIAAALELNALFASAEPVHRIDGRCHVPPLRDYDAARRAFVEKVFGER